VAEVDVGGGEVTVVVAVAVGAVTVLVVCVVTVCVVVVTAGAVVAGAPFDTFSSTVEPLRA
jgi:hypothetical protein